MDSAKKNNNNERKRYEKKKSNSENFYAIYYKPSVPLVVDRCSDFNTFMDTNDMTFNDSARPLKGLRQKFSPQYFMF
ncbi:hypothetical protein QTN25_006506 [Entamoeba marina]